MNRVFQTFVDSLAAGPDVAALRTAMEDIAAAFGLQSFAYLLTPNQSASDVKLVSNYPSDWTSLYLANGYGRFDPVIGLAQESVEPFEWGSGYWTSVLSKRQGQVMEEAAPFGIRCGFTIPIHDMKSRFAALTFAADDKPEKLRRCFELQRPVLHLLAILFHSQAHSALAPGRTVAGILLSPREYECLGWAAKGKSAWEIGSILAISRRTAAFHLENAKRKLGVRTIAQAVALLAESKRFNR